jgi:polar amino acid transport system substrate-binding protein
MAREVRKKGIMFRSMRKMRGALRACLLFGVAGIFVAANAVEITAYTEDWPPYNYAEETNIRGISTDILRATCELAKVTCDIHLVPWARAYQTVLEKPDTLVYTTARKPSRAKDFLWVGPILPRTTWVYGRSGESSAIKDFKDLAKLRVGVVREEAARQDLEAAGVPASAFVVQSSNADVLRMLNTKLVDAMVDTEIGMAWNLRSAGTPAKTVTKLMKLTDDGAYYFALNLKSDPGIAIDMQAAFDKLKRDGKVDAIIRNYTVQAR